MLLEPVGPAAEDVHLADRVAGEMAADGVGEEFDFDAVVFEGVEERIGLRDGDARVAGVVQQERRRFDFVPVGDGRLRAIVLEIVADVG